MSEAKSSNFGINKEIDLYQKYAHKVKLGKLYETLNITPNQCQAEMIDDIDNNYKDYWFFTVALGRRSGKSYGMSCICARELLVPYSSVAIIAPTAKVTEIIWDEVKKRLIELGMKPTTINNQERKLTLENGAKLICGSVNSPDALLGNRFSAIIVDEAAIDDEIESIIEMQLQPTQSDFGVQENGAPYGRIFLVSSPRGKSNYFYRQYLKGITGVKGHKSYRYGSKVNPLNSPQFLENIKLTTDPLVYAQEYEAEFVSVSNNNIMHSFDENKNLFDFSTIAPFLKDLKVIAGIDIGFRDASCEVLIAKDRAKYYVFSSVAMSQSDTASIITAFKANEAKYCVVPTVRFCDRTAAMFAADAASTYDFITYPSVSDIRLGFALLNQLFREGNLFIEKSLESLISQIVSAEWTEGKGNDIKRTKSSLHFDELMAMRYAVYTDFKMNSSQDIVVI